MTAPVRVCWGGGGEGQLLSLEGDAIALRSTVSSPPGSRIEGTVVGCPALTLRFKVHSSKRAPEGDFVLNGRPLDLSRRVREALARMLAG